MSNIPPSPKNQNPTFLVLMFIFGFAILFLLMRINRVAFLIVLGIMLLATLVVYVNRQIRQKRDAAAFARSSEGVILTQINTCAAHIERLKSEILEIRQNITELKEQVRQTEGIKTNTRTKTEKLILAFENELKLRNLKQTFYKDCQQKLQTLLKNHRLMNELENKQQKLKNLQEARYEELADMEAVRSNLEYEQHFLETVETLSLRMLSSDSADKAEALQIELDNVSEDLRNL